MAERVGGTVVNADAMQVYRDLSIISARPTAEDEARVPHALYGHIDATTPYSVAAWLRDAARAIADARAAGRVPVIVGGTGLYLAALTEGLSHIPNIPADIRAHWRTEQDRIAPAELHAALQARDPQMAARLRPTDPQRIVRALEVIDATGRSLARWQEEREPPLLPLGPSVVALRLAPERASLRAAIARRFEMMMEEGALEEAARLAARKLDPALPAMKAIGVPPLIAHARGDLTRREAVDRAVTESRQFAKRQDTWLRGRLRHWPSAPPEAAAGHLHTALGLR